MASTAYTNWMTARAAALDAVERAHTAIRGSGPGRREATRQLTHAYAVLLAAEFQGFCRELHTEAIVLITAAVPVVIQEIVRAEFTWGRQLDRGNASPSTLGADFGRFGIDLWATVAVATPSAPELRRRLDRLNVWRNAIAHNDFNPDRLGGTIRLNLGMVRRWRRACHRTARVLDRVLADHFQRYTGVRPW